MKKKILLFLVIVFGFLTIDFSYSFEAKQLSREEIDKIKCDLNFKGKLEKGFNYTFNDTFINSSNREIKIIESFVYYYEEEDFNKSNFFSDVNFSKWALSKNNIFKPGDKGIITELNDKYKILKVPKKSKQDNFIIKYTLGLYYKDSFGKFTDGPHFHTECKQYKIVGDKEPEVNPVCNNIKVEKTFGINKLTTKVNCNFSDIKKYKIDCGNGDISIGNISKLGNGDINKICIYKKPGNYQISCIADNKEVQRKCKQNVYIKKEILDESNIRITYQKYKLIEYELEKIKKEDNKRGKGLIKIPKILPKTGTPISDRVKKLNNTKLDLEIKKERFILAGSKNIDINFWKSILEKKDRNFNKYIVLPSNGLVMPINNIPKNVLDYKKLISGREIKVNKYLKNGSMEYPGTSINGYGEVGNKVIFGHSSYWKSDDGRYKTDFQKIIELDPGEEIWIYEKINGKFKRFKYKVISSYETNPENTSVLKPGIGKNLTLFTCTPIGGIAGRWIIRAKYIDDYKIELEKKIKFSSINRKLKIKIINLIKKVGKNKKKVLFVFNKIVEKENVLKNYKQTEKVKKILDILEYLKYKLALEYYK